MQQLSLGTVQLGITAYPALNQELHPQKSLLGPALLGESLVSRMIKLPYLIPIFAG